MSAGAGWTTAFPLQPAKQAVEAVCQAWQVCAKVHRPHFNRKTHEPKLTKPLCAYISRHTAPRLGLLGMWSSEGVIGEPDILTGEMTDERRTDIVYGWNNDGTREKLELVFEFKRLKATKVDRDHYLGDNGLQRFVTGNYSHGQACAVMVGILRDPKSAVVPPLIAEFAIPTRAQKLALVPASKTAAVYQPSNNFAVHAEFDTEHLRPPPLGPSHGRIQVSHMFLAFGYSPPAKTAKAVKGGKAAKPAGAATKKMVTKAAARKTAQT